MDPAGSPARRAEAKLKPTMQPTTQTSTELPATDLVTRRLIPFRRTRVLSAFLDPARLERWWGPAGFTNEFEVCEPVPGGLWRFTMIGPDGTRYANECRFVSVGPESIVIRHVTAEPFVLILQLAEAQGGTELTWRQSFETAEVRRRVEAVVVPSNEENIDRLLQELERG